jgi:(p)ppGpp synthase/HD superfamily hydrolase
MNYPVKTNLYVRAMKIMLEAHHGVTRRGGRPYAEHPIAVASWEGFNDSERAAALLHDVVEDSNGKFTFEKLFEMGIPRDTIEIINALTKRPGESYDDFISRVIESGYSAQNVKYRDILDNLSDGPTQKQIVKYAKALERLAPHIGAK